MRAATPSPIGALAIACATLPCSAPSTAGLMAIRASTNNTIKDALRCLAGPASECIATGHIDRVGCRTDIERATRYARQASLNLVELWPDALQLIERHQAEIETLTEALLARGRLDGQQIDTLIGGGWISPRWAI